MPADNAISLFCFVLIFANRQKTDCCGIISVATISFLLVMVIGSKDEVLKEIGESLRLRRLGLNMTQAEAAERSGISGTTLRNFESGGGMSLWGFVALCRTYGHDGWVYELSPETIDEYANRLRPTKVRQRAAKRKEVQHV